MNNINLTGKHVRETKTNLIGTIEYVRGKILGVNIHGEHYEYTYPDAFAKFLEIEDEKVQEELVKEGNESAFSCFKKQYQLAINTEINFLKRNGGKKIKLTDGEKLDLENGEYLYYFETDQELHFPNGTAIKLWIPGNIILAYVVSCEEFTILIKTMEDIGNNIESVDITSEQWHLLEALIDRVNEMSSSAHSIAYKIACNGEKQIDRKQILSCGQNAALCRGTSEQITFIWGPPGTGKTKTLTEIAYDHIKQGRRVLMLSYSNVSVDGALLKLAKKKDLKEGQIIRYGYPRVKELLDSNTLTSYKYILSRNPEISQQYQELIKEKKNTKRNDSKRIEINKKINNIRNRLLEKEKELIQNTAFLATTVSKATVDKAVYMQRFDVVIFDEASMAYVPQIVFAAGLAKRYFVCLGDFCQLPAVVQNNIDDRLSRDIFEYTGITKAINNNLNHKWLIMLNEQFRMHSEIADFVSREMYGRRLKTAQITIATKEEIALCNPLPGKAMTMIDLSGMYSVCTKTRDGSRINIMSAMICVRTAELIINHYEVGIITPYSAQSRLILSMIRDLQEKDERWKRVSCATVHQFQGSEKPVIIYDAVDCFRMPYPGTLLTSLRNDTANRLFNVAITRTEGKFILVSNLNYLMCKNISKNLIFTKVLVDMCKKRAGISGEAVLDELMPKADERPLVYLEDREQSWNRFLKDISEAMFSVRIDIPDIICDDNTVIKALKNVLKEKADSDVMITIRKAEAVDLPPGIQKYAKDYSYVVTPLTIIDKRIVWFGHPVSAADFISEGEIIETEYFSCIRFEGCYFARSIQSFI